MDRNARIMNVLSGLSTSLSARRAWIEIDFPVVPAELTTRRSPQGERG